MTASPDDQNALEGSTSAEAEIAPEPSNATAPVDAPESGSSSALAGADVATVDPVSSPEEALPPPVEAPLPVAVTAPVEDVAVRSSRQVLARVGLLFLLLSSVAVVHAAVRSIARPVDLAAGKPWRASSTLFQCRPEAIECGGTRTSIFFHTQEENEPWVEFDLGAPTQFRSLWVRNRTDAVRERAVPLVVEVSDDRASWREVARRYDVFSEWAPTFDATTARYVRLRVTRRSFLHLTAVQVWP